jgi:hypothetical protein
VRASLQDKEKEKKKYEAPPPPRVGRRKKKKGPEGSVKLPVGTNKHRSNDSINTTATW